MVHRTRSLRAHALALASALAAVALSAPAPPAEAAEGPRLTGVVNVNTATLDELQLLPGIGESRARAIITARTQRGGFKSVDELVEVKGIGEASLARLKPFVRVSGKTTARIE